MNYRLAVIFVALALMAGCSKSALVGIQTGANANIADVRILRTSGNAETDRAAMNAARQQFRTSVPSPLANHKYSQRVNVEQSNAKPMSRKDFAEMSAVLSESPTIRKMFEEKCRNEVGPKFQEEIKRSTRVGGPKGSALMCSRVINAIAKKRISLEEFNSNIRGSKLSPRLAAILRGK